MADVPKVGPGDACAVCEGPRPEVAVAHGDAFCTSSCARKWHGCELAYEQPSRWGKSETAVCSGCGGDLDGSTPGCDVCVNRHRQRARYKQQKDARAAA